MKTIIQHLSHIIPDKLYLKIKYYIKCRKRLNIKKPKTFNEKLQWLKLHERNNEYTKMVDKYEAKKYVANIIGKEYIIPTYGIYNNFDEINFDKLPKQFVIKCTHDSGGLVIVKDKNNIKKEESKKLVNKCLKRNYFYVGREWPYKNVKPRIIVEKYMSIENDDELIDFKVHCFNGIPKIILVCKDRYKRSGLTEDFYDIEWNHLDIKRPGHNNSKTRIEKPSMINKMIELSKILSKNMPFVRIDFYIIKNKIYFGEITFFPGSGFIPFVPEKWDRKIGDLLEITNIKNIDK